MGEHRGERLVIAGSSVAASWLWVGPDNAPPAQLWLPLDVLEGKLGFRREAVIGSDLGLRWYGEPEPVPPGARRTLGDEVAIEVARPLADSGVRLSRSGGTLTLSLPAAGLRGIRVGRQGRDRRLVLDLTSATFLREEGRDLLLGVQATAGQLSELRRLGLNPDQRGGELRLRGAMAGIGRSLTLADPWRVVLDGPAPAGSTAGAPGPASLAEALLDPAIRALVQSGVTIDRSVARVGVRSFTLTRVTLPGGDGTPWRLRPLVRPGGMTGLSQLSALARQHRAPVAINGGFFNRVRQLPLGALRLEGTWLSGPILNRGAAGWNDGELPSFDRLRLLETVRGPDGRPQTVLTVNSGYVQRGLSRYTRAWGPVYRALSGQERAVLVRDRTVVATLGQGELSRGVPLADGVDLIVSRAGAALPWRRGDGLQLESRPSAGLGGKQYVIGGGPLLLQRGRVVLNGSAEGFSAAFQKQSAPRTVLGSDGRRIWLATIEGVSGSGPTLVETSLLLRQLGVRDALNLDGGSSTGLVVADRITVMGRGVTARVHNGVGLVRDPG
jgi:hypothetical protein